MDSTYDPDRGFIPDVNPRAVPLVANLFTLNPRIETAALRSATSVNQRFDFVAQFDQPWLPYAYPANSFTLSNLDVAWDPVAGTAGTGAPIAVGTSYSVTSYLMRPTPNELNALARAPASPRYTYTGPLDSRIQALATRWTAGANSTYAMVMDIQRHLTAGGFRYDINVPTRSNRTALTDFLFHDRRGFCQQFAAAMAILLRSLGIPTRLAVGFDAGSLTDPKTDTWTVTSADAHTWPEVLFPVYGWLPFEPTPGGAPLAYETYSDPSSHGAAPPICPPHRTACRKGGGIPVVPGREVSTGKTGQLDEPRQRLTTVRPDRVLSASRLVTLRDLIGIAFLAGLLVLLLIPPMRDLRRRWRIRRAADAPRNLILVTYDVFTERAAELGFPRDPSETIEEFRARVARSGLLGNGDLAQLSTIAASAAYAADEPAAAEALAARQAASRTLADLRHATPRVTRFRGRYVRKRWPS